MQSQQGAAMAMGGTPEVPPYACWPPVEPWMVAHMQGDYGPSQFVEQPVTNKSSTKKQSRVWSLLKNGGSQGATSFESQTSSFGGAPKMVPLVWRAPPATTTHLISS